MEKPSFTYFNLKWGVGARGLKWRGASAYSEPCANLSLQNSQGKLCRENLCRRKTRTGSTPSWPPGLLLFQHHLEERENPGEWGRGLILPEIPDSGQLLKKLIQTAVLKDNEVPKMEIGSKFSPKNSLTVQFDTKSKGPNDRNLSLRGTGCQSITGLLLSTVAGIYTWVKRDFLVFIWYHKLITDKQFGHQQKFQE